MAFCTSCGNPLSGTGSFCTKCGAPIVQAEVPSEQVTVPIQDLADQERIAIEDASEQVTVPIQDLSEQETTVIEDVSELETAVIEDVSELETAVIDDAAEPELAEAVPAEYATEVLDDVLSDPNGVFDPKPHVEKDEAPVNEAPASAFDYPQKKYADLSGIDRSVYEGILEEEKQMPATQVISPVASAGFCTACGAPREVGHAFCTACGAPYDKAAPAVTPMGGTAVMPMGGMAGGYGTGQRGVVYAAPVQQPQPKRSLKGPIAAILALALVAGLATAFFVLDPFGVLGKESNTSASSSGADDDEEEGDDELTSMSASKTAEGSSSSAAGTGTATASSSAASTSQSSASASASSSAGASASASSASASASSASASSSSASSTSANDYILPESDRRYYSEKELKELSTYDLYLARNEIYARHGRGFVNEDLQKYFGSKSWYKRTVEPSDFSESVLNDYEKKNVETILKIEQDRDSPYLV